MPSMFKSLALAVAGAALFATGSMAPAGAATNQAVLTVNATVTNNCDVLTQPATLSMTYNPIQLVGTSGTSSFTYACTLGASVAVTPTSQYVAGGNQWLAEKLDPQVNLFYYLYNDLACASNQLSNGTSESLSAGTGASQTYAICGIPIVGQLYTSAGIYTDTVTFTFNFGP